MKKETWRPTQFKGYEVSSRCRVRSVDRERRLKSRWGSSFTRRHRGRVLRPCLGSHGYPTVSIGGATRPVHSLWAEAFLGPRLPGQQVRHLNDIKTDNRPDNIKYGTQAENSADAIRNGRTNAKLTRARVLEIRRRRANGERGKDLAAEFGVVKSTISSIATGKHWAHLPGAVSCRPRLTSAQVLEIRRRLANGERQRGIAADFGVTQANISLIATGKAWSRVRRRSNRNPCERYWRPISANGCYGGARPFKVLTSSRNSRDQGRAGGRRERGPRRNRQSRQYQNYSWRQRRTGGE